MTEVPLIKTFNADADAVAQAADGSVTVCTAPFAGTVTAVTYVPAAAITGANTDTRKVALVNKGQAGSGTTQVASVQFNSGTNAAAFDEKTLALSGTAADLVVAAGDVLTFVSTHVGAGLADPGGTAVVQITRSDAGE